ncbi:hypothetical protein P692DRAFT_201810509 [Suillus brevipes Sb2]|nr:hypothetical protein P692DRAFT_201810509 [Suillus brevipes Sb2]
MQKMELKANVTGNYTKQYKVTCVERTIHIVTTYQSSQDRPDVQIECVGMKVQANRAILLWFNTAECCFNHLAYGYVTESESVPPCKNSTHRSTLVLLPKRSLIHIPQPGGEETQSKFAMTDSGDGRRGVEVEEEFEGRSSNINSVEGVLSKWNGETHL